MKQTKDAPKDGRKEDADKPLLPNEADQTAESQHEEEPRDVGKQAHEDIERGLVDTDRRSNLEGDASLK
jgi:hypothetical protein